MVASQRRSFGRSMQDARRDADQDREVLMDDLEVSGQMITVYRPDPLDMAMLMKAATSEEDDLTRLAGVFNTVGSLMPSSDRVHVDRAIRARALSLDDLMDMTEMILEEAGGFPTRQPSGSTRSSSSGGRSSTAGSRRARSTPPASRSTGS